MISIDAKNELIGDFAQEGHTHTQTTIDTLDHDVLKEAIQILAEPLGLEIRIGHYCTKHNLIVHRLFSLIARACQGVVFHTVDIANQFVETANTATGLKVTVDIFAGIYEIGKKCAEDFIENACVVFDQHLPRWTYRALPKGR